MGIQGLKPAKTRRGFINASISLPADDAAAVVHSRHRYAHLSAAVLKLGLDGRALVDSA